MVTRDQFFPDAYALTMERIPSRKLIADATMGRSRRARERALRDLTVLVWQAAASAGGTAFALNVDDGDFRRDCERAAEAWLGAQVSSLDYIV